ncbi:Beta-glucosidase [Klebsormidium nitens]|uniref:Beta-glucosidase n=1 Tax=Klebsormidium nitens TaxID=105231 RepID=A0A1Y1HX33_KLENI|nr:Beta-glucosidase [Klebsormidium nitens]|eukprot:GAQ83224.1 Beta-glucosidase [Klebsormidium nitens]
MAGIASIGHKQGSPDANDAALQSWLCQEGSPIRHDMFPQDFAFGAATAAYQVEGAWNKGGRGPSIWDTFSHEPKRILGGDTGDIACDHYNRFKEDVQLIKSMGMGWYRFSISWSRVLPTGRGTVNTEGVAFYNELIDELLRQGVRPFVTLYHWDFPQALETEYGGWLNEQAVLDFREYARVCFREFGDRVKHWLTFNEPMTFSNLGWGEGIMAPGRSSDRSRSPEGNSATEPYLVSHNVLKAHAAAVEVYRQDFKGTQNGSIGITLDSDWSEPSTSAPEDVEAAQRRLEFTFGWFADPVFRGDYPASMRRNLGSRLPSFSPAESASLRGSVDFIGVNHYTSRWVGNGSPPESPETSSFYRDAWVDVTAFKDGAAIGPRGASEWLYIVPWGLEKLLVWISERYGAPPIYITENGVDELNDPALPLEAALHDPTRVKYYQDYLHSVLRAISRGVDVRGYMAWSLLDNFEWMMGYSRRFGLHFVDYKNDLKRYPKSSAKWWTSFLNTT